MQQQDERKTIQPPAVATFNSRLAIAYHEVGHMVMRYWRNEALHTFYVVLHDDQHGSMVSKGGAGNYDETDLMVLIGGPMAECLACGVEPKAPLRFSNEYKDSNSDSSRMRKCIQSMRGKDDRRYQFEVQERVRAIMEEPRTWEAIGAVAALLEQDGKVSGEYAEQLFEDLGVPTLNGTARA